VEKEEEMRVIRRKTTKPHATPYAPKEKEPHSFLFFHHFLLNNFHHPARPLPKKKMVKKKNSKKNINSTLIMS